MRDAFFRELTRVVIENERVVVLTADLGIGLFDEIAESAPTRFLNVGIAEQNMIGIAAGLALAGRRVFVYSIAPFVTSRPHDQLRIDVAYHEADVTIVGVGGGLAYGALGPTHHAIEDLALMRALPNMTVVAPGSPSEAASATRALADRPGPSYLRLAKNGEPECLPDEPFRVGVARLLLPGNAATICSTGALLPNAIAAADRLNVQGIATGVLHMPTVKPLDVDALCRALQAAPLLVTLEEHTLPGGFGSAVAEAVVDHGLRGSVLRLGVPDCFAPVVGSREHLLELYGLSPARIADTISRRIELAGGGVNCRICDHEELEAFLHLERAPVNVSRLLQAGELAGDAPIEIEVWRCPACATVQLGTQLVETFYEDYVMTVSHSPTMQRYQGRQAADFVDRFELRGRRVLEVGCGDGHYLSLLHGPRDERRGTRAVGALPPACRAARSPRLPRLRRGSRATPRCTV